MTIALPSTVAADIKRTAIDDASLLTSAQGLQGAMATVAEEINHPQRGRPLLS